MFLEIEAGLAVLLLVLALTVPSLGARRFEAIERSFGKLARRRGLSVAMVGLAALALRAALLPILPIPHPAVTDEYGYLLLSDTFAHGRVTNPSSPMWAHFENIHILWHPTYTAKFWPAQGMVMALGQALLGHPFWGVWLSVGLMCAGITWMLQAWVGEGWALLGGSLAVIRLGTFSYWANSYWGGAVAALGGALILGALPRLKKEHRIRNAMLMGIGVAILANSRPYEGLFFSLPMAVALLGWILGRHRPAYSVSLCQVVLPLCLLLGLVAVGMGYYNWRVTGSPFNTPYLLYEHTYDPVPGFPWQPLKTIPTYRLGAFREFYLSTLELPHYEMSRSLSGFILLKWIHFQRFWEFFLGPLFTLPLLLVWATWPYGFSWSSISSGIRFLLVVCGITLAGESLPIYFLPHYAAALTCVILALVLAALRRTRHWKWRGRVAGIFISRAVPSICVLLFALRVFAPITHWPPVSTWPGRTFSPTWCSLTPMNLRRSAVLRKLREFPGRQLAIVHYNSSHEVFYDEWVYNRANLNTAKVVWAHDMGAEENEELIRYFKNRRTWLVKADADPPELVPYPGRERVGESAR